MDPVTGSLILAGFNALITIAKTAIEKAATIRASALRNQEWTPEQEAEAEARLKEVMSQDHWKIEPNP